MRINSNEFRVRGGEGVNLKKWPTKVEPVYEELKMTYPKTSAKRRRELLSIRKQLAK
jgi:hypothetical protein